MILGFYFYNSICMSFEAQVKYLKVNLFRTTKLLVGKLSHKFFKNQILVTIIFLLFKGRVHPKSKIFP